jgi:hypothetical protein
MCRYVLAAIAAILLCLLSIFAWEQLIRNHFYKVYYRLFDYSTPIDYGGAYVSAPYFDDITKRQSADVQNVLKPLIADLRSKSYDDLIILKSDPGPCELSYLIDCKGIDEKIIKQYIEAAFAYRQFIETREDQRFYNKIAVGGLMFGMLSLLVALTLGVLQLRVKRNA